MNTEQIRSSRFRLTRARSAKLVLAGVLCAIICSGVGFGQTSPHGRLTVPCEACHTANSWNDIPYPLAFDHGKTTFPLKGQHALVGCRECHATLTFAGTSQDCAACHNDVHRGELGVSCERCHSPESWVIPDMVQRHARTRFSLVGAHASAPCESCHRNQQKHEYVGVSTECFSCHMSDYQNTRAPDHASAGLSTDCVQCHSIRADRWGTGFEHARVGFPLVGAHQAVACAQCHVNNVYAGTPTECNSCHQRDYATAVTPQHSPGMPTDCARCHTTSGWRPSTFDHSTAPFRLTGAHLALPCGQCHVSGTYAGTPSQCFSCHETNYMSAVNPQHYPGFPTDCASCHTTTAWQPSTFNHDSYFPISAGSRHQPGRWSSCSDCHTVPTNFQVFSCIDCHAHSNQSQMDSKHVGISGYSYNSTACYQCHPRGN